jgi:hypothetical protein
VVGEQNRIRLGGAMSVAIDIAQINRTGLNSCSDVAPSGHQKSEPSLKITWILLCLTAVFCDFQRILQKYTIMKQMHGVWTWNWIEAGKGSNRESELCLYFKNCYHGINHKINICKLFLQSEILKRLTD